MKKVIIHIMNDDVIAHHENENVFTEENFIEMEEFAGKTIKNFTYDCGRIVIEFE